MSSKIVSQIFKTLFKTGDINIFVLLGVFISRYVQLKSSFFDNKTSTMESETRLSRKEIGNQRGKVLELCKVIHIERLH